MRAQMVHEVARKVEKVFRFSPRGGNLHIAIDDGNLDDGNLESCERFHAENSWGMSKAALAAERSCLDALKPLDEPERWAACEIASGRVVEEIDPRF